MLTGINFPPDIASHSLRRFACPARRKLNQPLRRSETVPLHTPSDIS